MVNNLISLKYFFLYRCDLPPSLSDDTEHFEGRLMNHHRSREFLDSDHSAETVVETLRTSDDYETSSLVTFRDNQNSSPDDDNDNVFDSTVIEVYNSSP